MAFRMTGIVQLLRRHGRNVTLDYQNVEAEYDPETSTVEDQDIPDVVVRGYFYDTKETNGYQTQVEATNRRLILYPLTIAGVAYLKPSTGDNVICNGETTSIVRVDEIASGEKILFYICGLNK